MKVTIMIEDHGARVRIRGAEDPEYEFGRCIEKEGWEPDSVYIAERVDPAEVAKWLERLRDRDAKIERKEAERHERAEFERLKAKYGEKT